MGTVTTLERPVYGFHQVDQILRLRPGTARRWIDGYERSSHEYPPVVREHSTGVDVVTWGEFVETALLSQYRDVGIPMQRLRPVVDALRAEFGVRYPLAHARPFVDARELVVQIQDAVGLEPELRLAYSPTSGQVRLTSRALTFFEQIHWIDDIAASFRLAGADSPVEADPLRSFGAPTVEGIRTDVIAELVRAGESAARVARTYELDLASVDAAVEFERARNAA